MITWPLFHRPDKPQTLRCVLQRGKNGCNIMNIATRPYKVNKHPCPFVYMQLQCGESSTNREYIQIRTEPSSHPYSAHPYYLTSGIAMCHKPYTGFRLVWDLPCSTEDGFKKTNFGRSVTACADQCIAEAAVRIQNVWNEGIFLSTLCWWKNVFFLFFSPSEYIFT